MTDTPSKLFAVICLLLGVWILTYWLYEPSQAKVAFDPRVAELAPSPVPERPADPPPERKELVPLPKPTQSIPIAPEPAVQKTRKVKKVIEPQFKTYVVQKGDGGWRAIAARREVYGDANKWQAVAKANPFVSPDRLKPGVTTLKIAVDPDNIQGKVVEVEEPIVGEEPQPSPSPAPAPAEKTYTITRNDTLWEIAKRFYGKGSAWTRIYEANKDLIPDPDRPPAGVTIRIPQTD